MSTGARSIDITMEFDRIPLFSEHEKREHAVLEEYAMLLEPHIAASGGTLVLLNADPKRYQAQRLDCHLVDGDPAGAGLVELIATSAENRFPDLLETLETPEQMHHIRTAGEILKRGGNVMLVTNHGDLIDIALAFAATYVPLDKNAALEQRNYTFKTGMIISKIISRLGYVFDPEGPAVPAVDALKDACNDVMLSFPRTKSMESSWIFKFVPDHMKDHNRKLRKTVQARQEDGEGYLLGVAGSGSTDKEDPHKPGTFVMGSISDGTIDMMCQPNTFVMPAAVWRGDEKIKMRLGELRAVTNPTEAHTSMRDISVMLNELVEDKTFTYAG